MISAKKSSEKKIRSKDIVDNSLIIKLPTFEEITIDFLSSKHHHARVTDVKHKIYECTGFDHRRIRLFKSDYVELKDEDFLDKQDVHSGDTLTLVYRVCEVDVVHTQFFYDDFIRSTFPESSGVVAQIPIDATIRIAVGPNIDKHVLHIPSLFDRKALLPSTSGDMRGYYQGNTSAAKLHGYLNWTDFSAQESLLLIEVSRDISSNLEDIRYSNYGVNNGYCNGDHASWQRYTMKLPLECKYYVTTADDDHVQTITMTPYKHLKHDTYYAILFCNNVPTVPINLLEASWIAFTMGTMGEDKLVIFKTADSVDSNKT